MTKGRMEAFSDGVLAIVITIMVLDLRPPQGVTWDALAPMAPRALAYLLSFILVAIYWNNHHHMLHAAKHISGSVLWANMHLLFWLSLTPICTAWMGETNFASHPVALYGLVQSGCAIGYFLLSTALIKVNGTHSNFAKALGKDHKGKISLLLSFATIPLALVEPRAAIAVFAAIYVMWFIPDRRFEALLAQD